MHEQALRAGDPKLKAGLMVAALLGRFWLVALAIILARYAGSKGDGIMAAALLLAAFTVYLAMSFVTREGPNSGGAARARDAEHLMSTPEQTKSGGMSTKRKVLLGIGVWLAGTIVMVVVFGSSGKNASFLPQNEFKLDPWISIKVAGIDISITKAVLYVVLASLLTCATMIYIARRMQQRPNKVQTAVEVLFNLMRDNITRGNMRQRDGAQVVPVYRCAVPVHHVLQPDRLHPTADEHRARDHGVWPARSSFRAVLGDREPLDPACAGVDRVGLLHR